MKIGLSFSRCLKDIIDGNVDINDVLVIISRTNFDPTNDSQWKSIWDGYRYGGFSKAEWYEYTDEDEVRFRDLTIDLLKTGKLHQPRQFGGYVARRSEIWLEAILPNEELESNPAAKAAWEEFQVAASLTGVAFDRNYQ